MLKHKKLKNLFVTSGFLPLPLELHTAHIQVWPSQTLSPQRAGAGARAEALPPTLEIPASCQVRWRVSGSAITAHHLSRVTTFSKITSKLEKRVEQTGTRGLLEGPQGRAGLLVQEGVSRLVCWGFALSCVLMWRTRGTYQKPRERSSSIVKPPPCCTEAHAL